MSGELESEREVRRKNIRDGVPYRGGFYAVSGSDGTSRGVSVTEETYECRS